MLHNFAARAAIRRDGELSLPERELLQRLDNPSKSLCPRVDHDRSTGRTDREREQITHRATQASLANKLVFNVHDSEEQKG